MPKDAHVVLEDDSTETRPVADFTGDLPVVLSWENVKDSRRDYRGGESRLYRSSFDSENQKAVKKGPGDEVMGAQIKWRRGSEY